MNRKWAFWLMRILIYAGTAALLIILYNQTGSNTSTQSTILLIGKIFGITIVLFEVLLIFRNAVRRRNEE
jgi:hypothetical protein